MNTKILNKCIDELKKEKPNLQYVLGILETLVDMSSNSSFTVSTGGTTYTPPYQTINATGTMPLKVDEEEIIPDVLKAGPIGKLNY